jgi:predicted nuclease of predicted toxin-antitoxin system
MKFIVDNSLSWRLAKQLRDMGHDAVHVKEWGLASAEDPAIFARAVIEDRIILTQDVDFGTLLAESDEPRASVVTFRLQSGRLDDQLNRLRRLLADHAEEIRVGTAITLTEANIRIRRF